MFWSPWGMAKEPQVNDMGSAGVGGGVGQVWPGFRSGICGFVLLARLSTDETFCGLSSQTLWSTHKIP